MFVARVKCEENINFASQKTFSRFHKILYYFFCSFLHFDFNHFSTQHISIMDLFGFGKSSSNENNKSTLDSLSSSSFARAEDKAREEKLMEMETDLNVILQKKKDDGDHHPSSAEAYNNSSASSNNIGLLALIACAGLAAWFLLMKLPQSMPSPAAQAQMMRRESTTGEDGFGSADELEPTRTSFSGGENDGGGESFGEGSEESVDDDGGDFEDDYRDFRPVSRFQSDDFGDDYSYDDYDGDEGVDSGSTSTSGTKEEMQMDAAEQWLGEHHNKFFKNVVKELSMDEDGWERAAKKQFSMRKEIIKDAANMRKMEGYRSMLVLALEVATAIGALVSFKNWVESDIYMRDVIDLRQIVPKIPDKSNLLPVRERPTRPSAELVKKDISKLTTEELKAQLALLREQKS